MVKVKKIIFWVKDYFLIIIGCASIAFALDIFLVPHKIASGGVTGLATVVYYLSGMKIPVGITIVVLNIPLMIAGLKYLGKMFMIKSIISTLLLSLFVDLFEPFTSKVSQEYLSASSSGLGELDLMLFSIFGGVMIGVGVGLVFRAGGTTGGSDIAASLLHLVIPTATIGQILLVVDGIVVLMAGIAFKSLLLGLYAVIAIYIAAKIIDTILEGVNYAKGVYIISDYPEELSEIILKQLDRGVTALEGTGMYTGKGKKVLFCVLERTQIPKLKAMVKAKDPKAFIVMNDIHEVMGEFRRGKR